MLDDSSIHEQRASARALVLCSGKVYYDLLAEAQKRGEEHPPIARVEQIFADFEALRRGGITLMAARRTLSRSFGGGLPAEASVLPSQLSA